MLDYRYLAGSLGTGSRTQFSAIGQSRQESACTYWQFTFESSETIHCPANISCGRSPPSRVIVMVSEVN